MSATRCPRLPGPLLAVQTFLIKFGRSSRCDLQTAKIKLQIKQRSEERTESAEEKEFVEKHLSVSVICYFVVLLSLI